MAAAAIWPALAFGAPLRISGSVFYRERIPMPPGYVLEVQLLDISRQDTAAESLAAIELRPKHQVPVPFSLTVDESRLDPRHRYSIQAKILVDGRLAFISTRINPVVPGVASRTMNILLQRVDSR